MTDKENKWIKFCPSLELPKERVSIAYDTHDERGYRFAYGYFQFYNGTCGCFWKDGNEQPKVVKAEDIKYWMPIPSLDVQEEPVGGIENGDMPIERWKQAVKAASNQRNYRSSKGFTETRDDYFVDGVQWADKHPKEEPVSEDLEEAAFDYAEACKYDGGEKLLCVEHFKAGAEWQKEQLMKDSVLCGGDGWFINNKQNCRKNGRFHKYYVSTITHDKPLPMENGKDYRLIVIKKD